MRPSLQRVVVGSMRRSSGGTESLDSVTWSDIGYMFSGSRTQEFRVWSSVFLEFTTQIFGFTVLGFFLGQ